MSDLLIVFAKVPLPGLCKSRLAAGIGAGPAARVAEACLRETFRVAEAACGPATLEWHYDPAGESACASGMAPVRWRTVPQGAGDLGARLAAAFDGAFTRGFRRVAILGADSPLLPAEWLSNAFKALDQASVVFGPAEDGGYYLIGMTRPAPRLFEAIAWSTASVMQDTLERCTALGLGVHLLPRTYDVDTVEDLRRLAEELEAAGSKPEVLEVCRAALSPL
jgi:hypothetical protein